MITKTKYVKLKIETNKIKIINKISHVNYLIIINIKGIY